MSFSYLFRLNTWVHLIIISVLILSNGYAILYEEDKILIREHSIFPPMLVNYWEDELHHWILGNSTIVTDNYVRLARSAIFSTGSLWNRHSNHFPSFIVKIKWHVKSSQREKKVGLDNTGMGLWYVNEIIPNPSQTIYGSSSSFIGIGVVQDISGGIKLLYNDTLESNSPGAELTPIARCETSIDSLITYFQLVYDANSKVLTVDLLDDDSDNQLLRSAKNIQPCFHVSNIFLPARGFFGITASNSGVSRKNFELLSFKTFPLDILDVKAAEELNEVFLTSAEEVDIENIIVEATYEKPEDQSQDLHVENQDAHKMANNSSKENI